MDHEPQIAVVRSVVEAASWSLAVSMCRASPELTIRRHQPGGGQYDCLRLGSARGLSIDLNRAGRIHLHALEGGSGTPNWTPAVWGAYLENPREFVQLLQARARLTVPSPLPPTTHPVLVYRVVAALARLHAFGTPITIEMSTLDSSGPGGGGLAAWVGRFPRLSETAQLAPDAYWRVATKDTELVLETERALLHRRDGSSESLMKVYDDLGRRFDRLVGRVLQG